MKNFLTVIVASIFCVCAAPVVYPDDQTATQEVSDAYSDAIDHEGIQDSIRLWLDFGWELLSHPLITFLIGFFGGAHIDGGVRRLYGKAGKSIAKTVVHKERDRNE